jgi:hypothetical protein
VSAATFSWSSSKVKTLFVWELLFEREKYETCFVSELKGNSV